MIVVLNGPIGIGKSTLGELLAESIDGCVALDGDHLAAANPPHENELEHLHATIELLVAHHRRFGYRHFVVNHLWSSKEELDDLRRRFPQDDLTVFRLALGENENRARIEARQSARAIDELGFELETLALERAELESAAGRELGEPFDVSADPGELVRRLLDRLPEEDTDREA